MKPIVLALLVATLAGCAVVPVAPPVYIGGRVDYGGYYGGGYRGGPYYAPGPYWRR